MLSVHLRDAGQAMLLSEGQKEAIRTAARSPVCILTGGPGCGKTTTTKYIVDLWAAMDKQLAICAPTGTPALLPLMQCIFTVVHFCCIPHFLLWPIVISVPGGIAISYAMQLWSCGTVHDCVIIMLFNTFVLCKLPPAVQQLPASPCAFCYIYCTAS